MSNLPPISDPNPPPASPSDQRQKFKLSPELREHLGLAPADFPIYAAMIAAAGLFFLRNLPLELLISALSLGLAVFSCVVGMKTNPEFSRLTNVLKIIGYPAGLFVVVVFIALNFLFWNPNPQHDFFPQLGG